MPDLLDIYHHLPYPLRVAAASTQGWRLAHWRYSRATDRQVEEALAREHWFPEQWQVWQEERLVRLLQRASTAVPYYREGWARRRRAGDRASWEVLENWSVLTKQEVRAHNRAFLAEDCNPRRLYRDHTSGSTGTPISIWSSRETLQAWYSLFEARWRGWYGLSWQDRWAIFGWQLVVPYRQVNPPYWVWNAALRQLYLSVFHLSAKNTAAYVEALRSHRVTYLWGYASALSVLARHVVEQGLTLPGIRCVINNAEPLYPHQRESIAQAFDCPVVDTYGLAEMVCAASQCSAGRLHLWPETGIWEVLSSQADTAVPSGQPGRLVGTGLLNLEMPLIRYDTGDTVVLSRDQGPCACGRTLPILAEISGRTGDSLLTADGRAIGRLASVFKGDLSIQEAQIIQESRESIRLLLVPAEGYTRQQGQSIANRLRQRVGEMAITVELVDHIPRGANGKFRMVISKVNQG